jgi:hypothetical protein
VKWKKGQRERFEDVLVGTLGFTLIPLEDFGTGELLPLARIDHRKREHRVATDR